MDKYKAIAIISKYLIIPCDEVREALDMVIEALKAPEPYYQYDDTIRDSMIFLLALTGSSCTWIGDRFAMSKAVVHDIVAAKLQEHHVVVSIKELKESPVWWQAVIRKEVETLWENL